MNNGFIFIWRKLRENPIYTNSKAIHIWIECLMRASYKERAFYQGRNKVELDSGQFVMGYREFGDKLNLGTSTVKYWMDKFEDVERMIERKTNAEGTIVTILNWDEYQEVERKVERTQNDDETQVEPYNKDKKVEKDNKTTNGGKFDLVKQENGRYEYPDAFEEFWDVYPANRGTKKKAWRKWKARRNDGIENKLLTEAAKNYKIEVDYEETGKKYVKHGATFLGPDEHWRQYLDKNWTNPKPDKRPSKKYAPSIDDLVARGMSEENAEKKREVWLEHNGY